MERLGQYLLETLPNYNIVSFGVEHCTRIMASFGLYLFSFFSHYHSIIASKLASLSFGFYKMKIPFACILLHMWFPLTGVYILVLLTFPLKLDFKDRWPYKDFMSLIHSSIPSWCIFVNLSFFMAICTLVTVDFVEIITFSVRNMSRADMDLVVSPHRWGLVAVSELCI